jgi:uncharacterized protein (DUF305 family)
MSEDYLASEGKKSTRLQALAGGIIRNQTFEIGMLDKVESLIQDIDFERDGTGWHAVALQGLANKQQFMRAPTPIIQQALSGDNIASATDVQFAKAMIVHHEGALMMCDDYLNNPNTNNGYMERMCLDVLRDQAQEIQLMWNIVATYPGDHCAIKITPDMIKGMDDMMGHMDFSRVNCEGEKKMSCCCCKGMTDMDGHKDHAHKNHSMHKKGCKCCGGKDRSGKMEQCGVDFTGGQSDDKPVHHGSHHAH